MCIVLSNLQERSYTISKRLLAFPLLFIFSLYLTYAMSTIIPLLFPFLFLYKILPNFLWYLGSPSLPVSPVLHEDPRHQEASGLVSEQITDQGARVTFSQSPPLLLGYLTPTTGEIRATHPV